MLDTDAVNGDYRFRVVATDGVFRMVVDLIPLPNSVV